MFGLPMEMITMILSVLGGAVMKMWSQAQSDKADQQKALIQRFSASEDSVSNARAYQNPNAQYGSFYINCSSIRSPYGSPC